MEIDTSELFKNIEKRITDLESRVNIVCEPDNTFNGDDSDIDEEYDDEDLAITLEDDFDSWIVERGKKYYEDGKVKNLIKCGDVYCAQVCGSQSKPYFVSIRVEDEYSATYKCDCPYDGNCKHEYATLKAISNQEYEEVELKETISAKDNSLKTIIHRIPSDYLKELILSLPGKDEIILSHDEIKRNFPMYVEKEDYEYYYNNLYNQMLLNAYYATDIDEYLTIANDFLNTKDFSEVFKIVKSIIEAYNDSNKLNYSDIELEIMNKIGMLLRICYRRADENTKAEISKYKKELEENNYYDNFYLEDIINTI